MFSFLLPSEILFDGAMVGTTLDPSLSPSVSNFVRVTQGSIIAFSLGLPHRSLIPQPPGEPRIVLSIELFTQSWVILKYVKVFQSKDQKVAPLT